MSEHDLELSPAGQARREQILALALRRVRQRRRVRRAMAAAAVCVLMAGVAALFQPTAPTSSTDRAGIARITTVHNSVPRIAKLPPPQANALPTSTSTAWEVLDDQTLLLALRSAGRPGTITRSEGRARVVFADGRE